MFSPCRCLKSLLNGLKAPAFCFSMRQIRLPRSEPSFFLFVGTTLLYDPCCRTPCKCRPCLHLGGLRRSLRPLADAADVPPKGNNRFSETENSVLEKLSNDMLADAPAANPRERRPMIALHSSLVRVVCTLSAACALRAETSFCCQCG